MLTSQKLGYVFETIAAQRGGAEEAATGLRRGGRQREAQGQRGGAEKTGEKEASHAGRRCTDHARGEIVAFSGGTRGLGATRWRADVRRVCRPVSAMDVSPRATWAQSRPSMPRFSEGEWALLWA